MSYLFNTTQASESISQGDLIQITDNGQISYGIIITGDCDIQRGKFANTFSYTPLLEMDEFIFLIILKPYLEKLPELLTSDFIQRLRKSDSNLTSSDEHTLLNALFNSATGDQLIIDGKLKKEREFIVQASDKILQLRGDIREGYTSRNQEIYGLLLDVKKMQPHQKIMSSETVRSKLTTEPGDALYLGKVNEDSNIHYIAYLRAIREIHQDLVHTSPSSLRQRVRNSPIIASRIANLPAPYIYRLTQKIAAVFSDIGLPDAFDAARKSFYQGI